MKENKRNMEEHARKIKGKWKNVKEHARKKKEIPRKMQGT